MPKPESPGLTVDLCLVKLVKRKAPEILLVERANEPFGWALPGGFIEIGESAENAAIRECFEETGLNVYKDDIELFAVMSRPDRDPRGHNVSIVYRAIYQEYRISGTLKADSDATNVRFWSILELPPLAFDHKQIIIDLINDSQS